MLNSTQLSSLPSPPPPSKVLKSFSNLLNTLESNLLVQYEFPSPLNPTSAQSAQIRSVPDPDGNECSWPRHGTQCSQYDGL